MRPHRILAVYTKLAKRSLSKVIDDAAVQLGYEMAQEGDGMNRGKLCEAFKQGIARLWLTAEIANRERGSLFISD